MTYASPNALSVFRRLGLSGDLEGLVLADVTRELVPPRRRPDEETVSRGPRRPGRTATPSSAPTTWR